MYLPDFVSVVVDRTVGCDFATSKTVARFQATGHWLFCRLTAVSCISTLKDRVRNARREDQYFTDLYLEKIRQLEDKVECMHHDQDVNPIEIAYLRDLVEGVKPNKAAEKRKCRYRAAQQRLDKAEERATQAQHRDRALLTRLSSLSREELYATDAIDSMIESRTQVVNESGEIITDAADRDEEMDLKRRRTINHGSTQDRMFNEKRAETLEFSAALFQLRQKHDGSKDELIEKVKELQNLYLHFGRKL